MDLTTLAIRTFSTNSDKKDYKQLYYEIKDNVAKFIKEVDTEITKILSQHNQQIAKLKQQNQLLKQQLKMQTKSLIFCQKLKSHQQQTSIQENSKIKTHQTIKQFDDCQISEIKFCDQISNISDRKKYPLLSLQPLLNQKYSINTRSPFSNICNTFTNKEQQKKDSTKDISKNDTEALEISVLRQKFFKKKGKKIQNISNLSDKESIGEVLKKIRQKALTPRISDFNTKDHPQYFEKGIISPKMFGIHKETK